jgi:hypothetical protein
MVLVGWEVKGEISIYSVGPLSAAPGIVAFTK